MQLFNHQEEAAQFLIGKGGIGALWHEMGLGKTRTAIETFLRLRGGGSSALRMLVVAPLSLLDAAWGEDLKRFAPSLRAHNCHAKGIPAVADKDVYIVNYEAFQAPTRVAAISKLITGGVWMAVLDESSRLKNPKTITAKTLLKFREKFKHRIVMSGTPAPNGEFEYWAQMEFVRPGIFDNHFFKFRNTYFHLENAKGDRFVQTSPWMDRQTAGRLFKSGYTYRITPAKRQALMQKILPLSHAAKKAECLDLPDMIDEVREVEMGPTQKRAYHRMKEELIAEIAGREIAATAALAKIMKLREITSGFALDEQRGIHEIGETPKLTELEEVVQEAGEQQAIIWGNFHWEIEKIQQVLTPYGRCVTLYANTDDRNESIRDFIEGRARFLVAHPRSAAHGLTFVNCSLEIFFSLDWSSESYEQARARIHRAGQKKACTYVHIICKDSIDGQILKVLKQKKNAQEIIWDLMPRGVAA